MTDTINAPWTPEQVDKLNRFQRLGFVHEFTFGKDDEEPLWRDLPPAPEYGPLPLPAPATDGEAEKLAVHPIEKLWREVGLPEYFLGNGGTNHKLYALYDRLRPQDRKI